jgi:circadian clock protein KaiC
MHLVRMHHLLEEHKPKVVVVDPLSGLVPGGSEHDVSTLVLRIVDFLKGYGATGFFTALSDTDNLQSTTLSISSLVDTWLLLRNIEESGERNRVLYVLKSRGMAHSNQIREFLMTSRGVKLREVYIGPSGVLTGSARVAREAEERREEVRQQREARQRELAARASLRSLEAKIAALEAEKDTYQSELAEALEADAVRRKAMLAAREDLEQSRGMMVTPVKETRPNGRRANS